MARDTAAKTIENEIECETPFSTSCIATKIMVNVHVRYKNSSAVLYYLHDHQSSVMQASRNDVFGDTMLGVCGKRKTH